MLILSIYFFKCLSFFINFFANIKSFGVFIENVFVGISKVPRLNPFSTALKSSIPSIFSRWEIFKLLNLLRALGLNDIISRW